MKSDNITASQIRVCLILFFSFAVFAFLGVELWDRQVLNHRIYDSKAKIQSIRKIRLPATRGIIFTSDKVEIATNHPCWNISIYPAEMDKTSLKNKVQIIYNESLRIADCIGREKSVSMKAIERHLRQQPGLPLELFSDLTESELVRIWELTPGIKGLEVTNNPERIYPYGSFAVHLLGYTRKGDPGSAADRKNYNYYLPDEHGVTGIEAVCDNELRGIAGSASVLVNSAGFVKKTLDNSIPAQNGNDVILTIDFNAQEIAEELLRKQRVQKGCPGVIVVLDANTGAVIAMASSPNYAATDFRDKNKYDILAENADLPFLNRAVNGSYLPGSVIKPLCALACLENGINASEEVLCEGFARGMGYSKTGIRCTGHHGWLDVQEALKKSCNVYFVTNAVSIGIDALSKVYKSAGLGKKTGIEIQERSGIVPPHGKVWNDNETAYVGFGQGKIAVTPLQVALYFAALANGGTIWRPYLIQKVTPAGQNWNKPIFETFPEKTGELAASRESLKIVKEGLWKVVNEEGGSGRRAFLDKTIIYGKTGTADVELSTTTQKKNVWFAGFAQNPVTQKTYSIAVMIERGDFGGTTCAPIVKEFFDKWFPDPPPGQEMEQEDPEATEDAEENI